MSRGRETAEMLAEVEDRVERIEGALSGDSIPLPYRMRRVGVSAGAVAELPPPHEPIGETAAGDTAEVAEPDAAEDGAATGDAAESSTRETGALTWNSGVWNADRFNGESS